MRLFSSRDETLSIARRDGFDGSGLFLAALHRQAGLARLVCAPGFGLWSLAGLRLGLGGRPGGPVHRFIQNS